MTLDAKYSLLRSAGKSQAERECSRVTRSAARLCRNLLHSSQIDVSYFAAGIVAHLASDGQERWTATCVSLKEMLRELVSVVEPQRVGCGTGMGRRRIPIAVVEQNRF